MPRRSRGLGAGSQNPIRGLADLIKNLPPAQADRLRSSLVDAEDLLTFQSRNQPENQQRRKISGLVDKIVITAVSSVLGGFVSWKRLPDPRIVFYEVQTSNDNVFSVPNTFQILDTFFSVDGINTTTFVRVRGVRLDGETGLWSQTKSLTPNTIAPKVHSVEFYPIYLNPVSDPGIQRSLVYGGNLDPFREHSFYTMLSTSFYINRVGGGLNLWGYVSNRLKKFADAGFTPWDRVRFTVNGIHRLDSYFPLWTNNFEIDNANKTDFANFYPGELMSFYSKGGYTAAFGPFGVPIPTTLGGKGPNDPRRVTSQDAADGTFYWEFVETARLPARFDQAQTIGGVNSEPLNEAAAFQVEEFKKTHYLIFQDFDFKLDPDDIIIGIQASLKRRQPNVPADPIGVNLGNVRPDRTDGQDAVLEYRGTNISPGSNRSNVSESNIFNELNFGKFLDLSLGNPPNFPSSNSPGGALSGSLVGDPTGISNDGDPTSPDQPFPFKLFTGRKFTFSVFFRVPSSAFGDAIFTPSARRYGLISAIQPPEPGNKVADLNTQPGLIDLSYTYNSFTKLINNYQFRIRGLNSVGNGAGQLLMTYTPSGDEALLDKFHLMTVTWNGDQTIGSIAKVYIDGVLRQTASPGSGFNVSSVVGEGKRRIFFATRLNGLNEDRAASSHQCQVGIWNIDLQDNEIAELYDGKAFSDYRHSFGQYRSSRRLCHYFLYFPVIANIRDTQIRLIDRTGIRTDLNNKAVVTESWPLLGTFFYTDVRQCDTIPLAASDGIPHDNHLAIGYQNYGDSFDLWGAAAWTPAEVNDFYFGLVVQAENSGEVSNAFNNALVDHAKITIFTVPRVDREVLAEVSVSAANQFYLQRECFGALFSAIEVGDKIAEIVF